MAIVGNMLLLRRLRAAIQKVRFLLSFSMTRWLLRSASGNRRLSFKDQQGLLDFIASPASDAYHDALSSWSFSGSPSQSPVVVTRTMSRTWSLIHRTVSGGSAASDGVSRTTSGVVDEEEDINQKAEDFIRTFRMQLMKERQVSLELRYVRGDSLDRSSSD